MHTFMKLFEDENLTITESDTIKVVFSKNKFNKSFSEFLKKYPELTSTAIKVGSDAIAAYKTSKVLTTRFFARTTMEKKIYGDIVDILNKSGKFKMVTKKFRDGGVFYELVRK